MNKTRNRMKKTTLKAIYGYAFISIWIIGFLVFMLYPLIMSLVYSLSDVNITADGVKIVWNNFNNFKTIFIIDKGYEFLDALLLFFEEILLEVPIIIVFSLIIALLLNQKIKFRGFLRSIYFLPVIIASGPVIKELISQGAAGSSLLEGYGILNSIENSLPSWLSNPLNTLFSKIVIVFWFSGVQIIIFIAGLQKIDPAIYEASNIDGAGPWENFWKITLPSLKGLILINIIYTIVTLATFANNPVIEMIFKIRNENVKEYTGYGFASAMAWIYLVTVIVCLAGALLLVNGRNKEGKKKR